MLKSLNEMEINQKYLDTIWRKSFNNMYYNPIVPYINHYLLLNNKCKGDLLDFGCGYGKKSNIFREIGFNVTGIDRDIERIATARQLYSDINFIQYDIIDKLPFDDNSFDVVFSNSVFQYLDHYSALSECKRILKPNGCLILIENLKNNPITKLGRSYLKLIGHKYQSYPFNHFTYKEFTDLKNDFNNSSYYFFHFFSPLSHLKIFRNIYPKFEIIDNKIINNSFLRRYSWLSFFGGLNKK